MTNPLGERRKVRCPPGAGAAIFCYGSPPLPAAEALRLTTLYPGCTSGNYILCLFFVVCLFSTISGSEK